jgi:mono/diheme cytochrome c family protein
MNVTIVFIVGVLGVATAAADSGPPDGATVFKRHCARCHGESGKGDASGARALKVRPLVGDAVLASLAPAEIVRLIKSDAKHDAIKALEDVADVELEAAALFTKELAGKPTVPPP